MFKFFKSIDNFLIAIEDYVDYRVKTGKWLGDVKYIWVKTNKKQTEIAHKTARSKTTRFFLALISKMWGHLILISAIEKMATLIVDAFKVIKGFFIEITIIILLTFFTFLLLFNLFIGSPILFFASFFPTIFLNSLLLSALYYRIEEGQKNKAITILDGFQMALRVFPNLSIIILIHVVTSLLLIAAFFMFATFYSYLFIYLKVIWEDAFLYWIVIAPLFIILLALLFFLCIIAYQAYFTLLLERKNIFYSFKKSFELVKHHSTWFFFFYLFFCLVSLHVTYWISLSSFPFGFIVCVFFLGQVFLFLCYLLRRNFPYTYAQPSENTHIENKVFVLFLIIFGLATYIGMSTIAVNKHDVILDYIDNVQKGLVSQQMQTYTNTNYGYLIDYPGTWSIHDEEDKSTTIYNNNIQTTIGGVFVNIKVFPFSDPDFNKLYNVRAGLVSYDTVKKNVTIKISNLDIQDKYPAVKYSYFKPGDTQNEYSINYLIHKDDLMYKITFLTYDKNVQGDNSDLFEKMINSFRFTTE